MRGGYNRGPPPGSFPQPGAARRSRAATGGSNRSSLVSQDGLTGEELWALEDDTPDMSNPLRPSAERPLDTIHRMSRSFDQPMYPMGAEVLWPTAPEDEEYMQQSPLHSKSMSNVAGVGVKKKRSMLSKKPSRGSGIDVGPYPQSAKEVVLSSAHSSTTSLSFPMNKSQQSLSRPPSMAYSLDLLNTLAPREGGYAIAAQLGSSPYSPSSPHGSAHASPPNSFRGSRGPPAKSSGMRWSVGGEEFTPPMLPPQPGRLSPSTTISNLSTYTDDGDGGSSSGPSSPHLSAVQATLPVAPSPLSQQTTAAEIDRGHPSPYPMAAVEMPVAAAAAATSAAVAVSTKPKSKKERKAEEKAAEKAAKVEAKRAAETAAREKVEAARKAKEDKAAGKAAAIRKAQEDKVAAARKAQEDKAASARKVQDDKVAATRRAAEQKEAARLAAQTKSASKLESPRKDERGRTKSSGSGIGRRMSGLFGAKPSAAEIAAGATVTAATATAAVVSNRSNSPAGASASPVRAPAQQHQQQVPPPPHPFPVQRPAPPAQLSATAVAPMHQQTRASTIAAVAPQQQQQPIPRIAQQPPSPPRQTHPAGPRQPSSSPSRRHASNGPIVIPPRGASMAKTAPAPAPQAPQGAMMSTPSLAHTEKRGKSPSTLSAAPSHASASSGGSGSASSKKGLFSGLKKRFSIASMETAPTAPPRQRPASFAASASQPTEKSLPNVPPMPAPRPVIQTPAPQPPAKAPVTPVRAAPVLAQPKTASPPPAQRAVNIPPPVIVPPRGSSMAMLQAAGLSPILSSPVPPQTARDAASISNPSSVVVTPTTSVTTTEANSLFDRPTPPFRDRSGSTTSATGSQVTDPSSSSTPLTDDEAHDMPASKLALDAKGMPDMAAPQAVAAH